MHLWVNVYVGRCDGFLFTVASHVWVSDSVDGRLGRDFVVGLESLLAVAVVGGVRAVSVFIRVLADRKVRGNLGRLFGGVDVGGSVLAWLWWRNLYCLVYADGVVDSVSPESQRTGGDRRTARTPEEAQGNGRGSAQYLVLWRLSLG